MRNKNYGVAACFVVVYYLGQQYLASHWVKSRGGLIEHKNVGLHRDYSRDCRSALFASRQIKRGFFKVVFLYSREFCRASDRTVKLVARQAFVDCSESDILVHGFLKKLIFGILKNHSNAESHVPDLLWLLPDILAVEKDLTVGRSDKSVEHLHKR